MKWLIIPLMLMPSTALGVDKFLDESPNVQWKVNTNIAKGVKLKSISLVPARQLRSFARAYKQLNRHFERFMQIDTSGCNRTLEIRIIPLDMLGSSKYFPGEAEHSDSKQDVTGRYFRNTNVMYLVPRRHYYHWKKSFGHELAHHFFNACNVHFINDHVEHHAIYPFEESIDG